LDIQGILDFLVPWFRSLTSHDENHLQNPRLIRLTGKHPFNCEASLDELFDAVSTVHLLHPFLHSLRTSQGFLTPSELFFVRNHGAVPKVDGEVLETWSIRVHGLVENGRSFTLSDLKDTFPVVTLPVTVACCGNRRKEQNVVRKGLGFNWGAAAGASLNFY